MVYHSHTGLPPNFHFFFFNDTATTEIYTLSLHDALPIWQHAFFQMLHQGTDIVPLEIIAVQRPSHGRSEEHTSELQSQSNLVCRLLLEKKKTNQIVETKSPSTARTELQHHGHKTNIQRHR